MNPSVRSKRDSAVTIVTVFISVIFSVFAQAGSQQDYKKLSSSSATLGAGRFGILNTQGSATKTISACAQAFYSDLDLLTPELSGMVDDMNQVMTNANAIGVSPTSVQVARANFELWTQVVELDMCTSRYGCGCLKTTGSTSATDINLCGVSTPDVCRMNPNICNRKVAVPTGVQLNSIYSGKNVSCNTLEYMNNLGASAKRAAVSSNLVFTDISSIGTAGAQGYFCTGCLLGSNAANCSLCAIDSNRICNVDAGILSAKSSSWCDYRALDGTGSDIWDYAGDWSSTGVNGIDTRTNELSLFGPGGKIGQIFDLTNPGRFYNDPTVPQTASPVSVGTQKASGSALLAKIYELTFVHSNVWRTGICSSTSPIGFTSDNPHDPNYCGCQNTLIHSTTTKPAQQATDKPIYKYLLSQTTGKSVAGSCTPMPCDLPAQFAAADPLQKYVESGKSVTAYQASTAPAGGVCVSEIRVCSNGVLSSPSGANYSNPGCVVAAPVPTVAPVPVAGPNDCTFTDSNNQVQVVLNGNQGNFYATGILPCSAPVQVLCSNQVLDWANAGVLTPAPVNSGTPQVSPAPQASSAAPSSTYFNVCPYVPPPLDCTSTDSAGTVTTVLHGSARNFAQIATPGVGVGCAWESRVCNNGVLSSPSGLNYAENSCVGNTCSFNGGTVLDGQSVSAVNASTVPYYSTCQTETRLCSAGVLSGSFTLPAPCTVDAAPSPAVATAAKAISSAYSIGDVASCSETMYPLTPSVSILPVFIGIPRGKVDGVFTAACVNYPTIAGTVNGVANTTGNINFECRRGTWVLNESTSFCGSPPSCPAYPSGGPTFQLNVLDSVTQASVGVVSTNVQTGLGVSASSPGTKVDKVCSVDLTVAPTGYMYAGNFQLSCGANGAWAVSQNTCLRKTLPAKPTFPDCANAGAVLENLDTAQYCVSSDQPARGSATFATGTAGVLPSDWGKTFDPTWTDFRARLIFYWPYYSTYHWVRYSDGSVYQCGLNYSGYVPPCP